MEHFMCQQDIGFHIPKKLVQWLGIKKQFMKYNKKKLISLNWL